MFRPPGFKEPTEEQKKLLEEVAKKYGTFETDKPLTFVVNPGEQTWDIKLD
jgi:hypothetical protein